MFWDPDQLRARDLLFERIRGLSETNPVVMIDGPSGAGKTSLANYLAHTVMPAAQVINMDNIYPGWDGLDAAIETITRDVLAPLQREGVGRWRLWDWSENKPSGWSTVKHNGPMIVEGCGTLARSTVVYSHLRVWLDADERVRKHRALARDGAVFEKHWDQWQNSFDRYVERESPRDSADLILTVSGWNFDR